MKANLFLLGITLSACNAFLTPLSSNNLLTARKVEMAAWHRDRCPCGIRGSRMDVDLVSIGANIVTILATAGGATYFIGGKLGSLEENQKTLASDIAKLEEKIINEKRTQESSTDKLVAKVANGEKTLDAKVDRLDTRILAALETKIDKSDPRMVSLNDLKQDTSSCQERINDLREEIARQSGELSALKMILQPEVLLKLVRSTDPDQKA